MSEHTLPEIRVVTFPPGSQVEPPLNLEVRGKDGWQSLGVLGSVNFGGTGAEERAGRYRELVMKVADLLLGARSIQAQNAALLAALEECLEQLSHEGLDRVPAAIHAREAIREADLGVQKSASDEASPND